MIKAYIVEGNNGKVIVLVDDNSRITYKEEAKYEALKLGITAPSIQEEISINSLPKAFLIC